MRRDETLKIFGWMKPICGLTWVLGCAVSALAQDAAKEPPGSGSDTPPVVAAPEAQPTAPAAEGAAASNAKYVCETPDHNFGEFWSGPKMNHTFEIKNVGTDVLKIENVKPGCGCTLAGEYTKEIPPGGTGQIPFALATTALKTAFSKSITVTTNDPANKTTTLKLSGTAKPYITVDPASVVFGKVKYNDDLSKTVKITNNFTEPLTLELVKDEKQTQFATELKEISPGKDYELVVSGVKPYTEGLMRGAIKIKTNNTNQQEISIQAMANLPPRLELNKQSILIPKAQSSPLTHTVLVTNNGDKPVKVVSATVDAEPGVTTTVTERGEGKVHSVEVTFPADYLPPETGRKLVLKTDDADKPSIEVAIARTDAKKPPANQPKKPVQELVGQKAPSVQLSSQSGTMIDTSNPDGKVMILDFVTSWCPHCKKQAPVIEELYQQYKDNPGVQFALISEDSTTGQKAKTPEEVVAKFKEVGVTFDMVLDFEKKMGTPFKAQSFPTLVVVGKDGTIEAAHPGNAATLKETLKTQIDLLLAGKNRNDFPGAAAATANPERPTAKAPVVLTPTVAPVAGNPDAVVEEPAKTGGDQDGE